MKGPVYQLSPRKPRFPVRRRATLSGDLPSGVASYVDEIRTSRASSRKQEKKGEEENSKPAESCDDTPIPKPAPRATAVKMPAGTLPRIPGVWEGLSDLREPSQKPVPPPKSSEKAPIFQVLGQTWLL